MPSSCPQCGAVFTTAETCADRFTTTQFIEVEQPPYYAVHHLSVPCFMLQHNAYSQTGWLAVRQLLHQFIYEGWTPAMARREGRVKADSRNRTWSFTKGPKLPGVEQIAWTYTIADVQWDTAEIYCAQVRQWAVRVLADSETLVRPK